MMAEPGDNGDEVPGGNEDEDEDLDARYYPLIQGLDIVVAATSWTTWLSKKEMPFGQNRVSKEVFVLLIFTRANAWDKATNVVSLASDSLWKVNP
ncbi:hypothetical protein AgCh_024738 [Apium graveolens]